jgi:hypothetical protein
MVPVQLLPGSGRGGRPLPKESGQAPEVSRLWKTGKQSLQEIAEKVRPSKTTVDEILKRRGRRIPVQVRPDLTPRSSATATHAPIWHRGARGRKSPASYSKEVVR